jgi:hypothetical protein
MVPKRRQNLIFFIKPLKMDLTDGTETSAKLNILHQAFEDGPDRGSETSAKLNQTPGKYPKENIQVSEHGENLKSRMLIHFNRAKYKTMK